MARRRLNLSTPQDIRKSANRIANMLLNGELGAKAGQAIISACKVCLDSIRADEQERRLDELEKRLEETKQ
ncbi:MAG: hypothetical protein OSJ58_11320 [Dysosmobacter sp.]|nr:hypothetical protein [Dysosmobacter sp.]